MCKHVQTTYGTNGLLEKITLSTDPENFPTNVEKILANDYQRDIQQLGLRKQIHKLSWSNKCWIKFRNSLDPQRVVFPTLCLKYTKRIFRSCSDKSCFDTKTYFDQGHQIIRDRFEENHRFGCV